MFRVPSTPDSRRASRIEGPSTTPAGPPPTGFTAQSFTPAGPPPTSVFGSSFASEAPGLSNAKPAFGPSGQLNSPSIKAPLHTNPFSKQQFGNVKGGFAVPSSSPPRHEEDGEDSYDEDVDGESAGDENMDMEETRDRRRPAQKQSARESIETPSDIYDYIDSPRGSKRSRNGDVMRASVRSSRAGRSIMPRDSALPGIAKSMGTTKAAKQTLEEPDTLVVGNEAVLDKLDKAVESQSDEDLEVMIGNAVRDLMHEWHKNVENDSLPAAIGPQQKSGLTKANYLASLLFQLHHPSPLDSGSASQQAVSGNLSRSGLVQQRTTNTPVPKALLDWLNTYHNPYPDDLSEVQRCRPSSTAHERFWDTVYSTILRGDINTTIQLLSSANFAHADTAIEDGYDEPGYKGKQLSAVQQVVGQCVQLLKTCPAVQDDDWNVTGTEWTLFRNRVRRALSDLEAFAEEDREDGAGNTANVFQSSRLGESTNSDNLRGSSRRAESKVPWSIYEQLKTVYGQLQGFREETLLSAQDWLEAVIYLTVWWDGTDDEAPTMASSRRSLRYAQHTRQVDVSPLTAYRKRLLLAFADVTDEPEDAVLGVNTVDPVQVGLASICEDNVEGVIGILRTWSLPVAAAVADVASVADWLPQSRPRSKGLMDGFDQEDLMVLSHGQAQKTNDLSRDDLLDEYAQVLAQRGSFDRVPLGIFGKPKQGWELAVQVLSRLESGDMAQKKIGQVLDNILLDSAQQVDKVLAVCNSLGLAQQVRRISERYANTLAESSQSYGEAILYYARARSEDQLRSTVDLLISMSLVQSAAYPPSSALDSQLDALVNEQAGTLRRLSAVDMEAARLIATHLSGYATLRNFYELRDLGDEDNGSLNACLRPLARKRESAKAILGLIEAAADSIHGGLYDAEANAVVKVDTLLALLGEVLPLLGQTKPLVKSNQLLSLLRAAEDLQTVTLRVYEQAEALFQAAMSNFHGASSPQDLAKSMHTSTSNLSGSSFAMVTSQGSIVSADGGLTGSQEEVKRGWDWRKGIALSSGKNAQGKDVLRILRIQVAKDMARSWAEGI